MIITAIIIASVLLASLLAWKEFKRPQRAHLALRLIATLLAVASLACFIVPVQYPVTVTGNNGPAIVLLTKGADKNAASAFTGMAVYTTDPALTTRSIQYIPDITWFFSQHPFIQKVTIAGYGLTTYEQQWLQKQAVNIIWQSPPVPEGFIAADWARQLHPGDILEVQGVYHHTGADSVKIYLSGLGIRFDSVSVAGDTSFSFSLHCKPVHLGNTLYELSATSAGNKTIQEKLPVVLLPATGLQVLVLSSSPDFDNRFLVNWLYENKYKVAARHTVSKNKYGLEYLNVASQSLHAITTPLLEKTDVVVTDDQSMAALGATEKAALQAQVKKGMGLIIQTDSTLALSSFTQGFAIKKQLVSASTARPLKLVGQAGVTAPILPEQWFAIESNRSDLPLVTDNNDAVLVAAHLYGAGKVMANTVSNTYSWILSGNRSDYAQFWSLLLHKAARQQQQDHLWQQATDLPVIGSPVQLTLQSAPDRIPVIHTPGGKVYVSQQAALPDTWTGTWWPVEKGWQSISSGDTTSLYIYDAGDWAAAKAFQLMNDNKAFANRQQSADDDQSLPTQKARKQVPLIIFFGIFLLCCGYLWIEAKQS